MLMYLLTRKLLRYYDRPRGRIACFFGAIIVAPCIAHTKNNVKEYEKKLNEETILLGRVELLGKMLSLWWDSTRKEKFVFKRKK